MAGMDVFVKAKIEELNNKFAKAAVVSWFMRGMKSSDNFQSSSSHLST